MQFSKKEHVDTSVEGFALCACVVSNCNCTCNCTCACAVESRPLAITDQRNDFKNQNQRSAGPQADLNGDTITRA